MPDALSNWSKSCSECYNPKMTPHGYSEDQLVEKPAIDLFAELGWEAVSALEGTFGTQGTLGRETKGEVVLVPG